MRPVPPTKGEAWSASLTSLSSAYGLDRDSMATAVYAMAEQIHQHYCMSRGIAQHNEARPDQHVATSVLMTLAGSDWWMVRSADIARSADDSPEG